MNLDSNMTYRYTERGSRIRRYNDMAYSETGFAVLVRPAIEWLSRWWLLVFLAALGILETINNIEDFFGPSHLSRTIAYIAAALGASAIGAKDR